MNTFESLPLNSGNASAPSQLIDLVDRLKKIGKDLEDLTTHIESTMESSDQLTLAKSDPRYNELLLMHLRTRVMSMISGVDQAVNITESMKPDESSSVVLN